MERSAGIILSLPAMVLTGQRQEQCWHRTRDMVCLGMNSRIRTLNRGRTHSTSSTSSERNRMSLQIINAEDVPLAQRTELWLSPVLPGAAKGTGTLSGVRILTSGSRQQINVDGIKRFIEQHLDDALLSLEQIAAHFSCSKRTLHRVFAANGESIERYIWRRRIVRCARELGSEDTVSLTDLAYRYGFNSSTHFSRLFKKHYGMTPTAYIRLQRQTETLSHR
jgi:AraC-like DNA-binding protein